MTKEEIWSLPSGSYLCCTNMFGDARFGRIRKRKDARIFHTLTGDSKPLSFKISRFDYYRVASKEEYVLWRLER